MRTRMTIISGLAMLLCIATLCLAAWGLNEPPIYYQADSRWANEYINSGRPKYLMKDWGCAVCSVAMMANGAGKTDADPLNAIRWRDQNNNWITNSNSDLNWNRVDDYAPQLGAGEWCGTGVNAIKAAIDSSYYVILKMTISQGITHFILAWSYDQSGIKVKDSIYGDDRLGSSHYKSGPHYARKFKDLQTDDPPPPPPPDDSTRAGVATTDANDLGEGYWQFLIESVDSSGQAGGVRSIHAYLNLRFHNPLKQIELGKHFSTGNPPRFQTEFIWDSLPDLEAGTYELYVDTEGGDGRVWNQFTNNVVDLAPSTSPPIRVDDRLTQDEQGIVRYWLRSQAQHGRRFVNWMNIWVCQPDGSLIDCGSANVWEGNWLINSQALGLIPGQTYSLYHAFGDIWGTRHTQPQDSGRSFQVPELLIPLERGAESLIRYEPSGVPWWRDNTCIGSSGWFGPYGRDNQSVDFRVYIEGTQHHVGNIWHDPVIYGLRGYADSYKVMGSQSYGYWLPYSGNINELPTGLHVLGAEMHYDDHPQENGPIRAQDAWLWVDNDPPEFDRILVGPVSGQTISKAQGSLIIYVLMQDPGAAGTKEFQLTLVGDSIRRDFDQLITNYHGQVSCQIQDLPNGCYTLVVSYAKDRIGNLWQQDRLTGVSYALTD